MSAPVAARGGAAAARGHRFLTYLAVGALATAAHYALLVTAVEWGRWPPWLASGVGGSLGAQVAYIGNRAVTFAYDGAIARSWLRFQFTALGGAAIGMLIVALAVRAGLHYLLGQALATAIVAALTYSVNRHWTFTTTRDRG